MYSSVFHQRCEYKGWLIHTFDCDTSINSRILDGAHLERHSKVLVFINALLLAEEVVALVVLCFMCLTLTSLLALLVYQIMYIDCAQRNDFDEDKFCLLFCFFRHIKGIEVVTYNCATITKCI